MFLISFSFKEKAEDTIHVFFASSLQPVMTGRVKLRDIFTSEKIKHIGIWKDFYD